MNPDQVLVLIRGAGDLASGTAHRLYQAGFSPVMLELPKPTVIRRTVSFAEAVWDGKVVVEGVEARLATGVSEIREMFASGLIPIAVDPKGYLIRQLGPRVVVDARVAKRNLGTSRKDAGVVIGLGPGFSAGTDVHAVIETNRGHALGRVILAGEAEPDTRVPGLVGGYSIERLVRAPGAGRFRSVSRIGQTVSPGEILGYVEDVGYVEGPAELVEGVGCAERPRNAERLPVQAQIAGVVRGLIRDGMEVTLGLKIGDIDPRCAPEHCFTISDKARAIGGGVLEAIMYFLFGRGREH